MNFKDYVRELELHYDNEDEGVIMFQAHVIETPDDVNKVTYFKPSEGCNKFIFRVKASNDAQIELTSDFEEGDLPRVSYKIIIGGWGNSKSAIRKHVREEEELEVRIVNQNIVETPNMLDNHKYQGFAIGWQGNTISLWKEFDSDPIVTFHDTELINAGQVGFSTGWGASGEWEIGTSLENDNGYPICTVILLQ